MAWSMSPDKRRSAAARLPTLWLSTGSPAATAPSRQPNSSHRDSSPPAPPCEGWQSPPASGRAPARWSPAYVVNQPVGGPSQVHALATERNGHGCSCSSRTCSPGVRQACPPCGRSAPHALQPAAVRPSDSLPAVCTAHTRSKHPRPPTLRMKRSPVSAIAARARLLVSAKCCPRSMSRFLAAAKVSLSSEEVRVVYLQARKAWNHTAAQFGASGRQYGALDRQRCSAGITGQAVQRPPPGRITAACSSQRQLGGGQPQHANSTPL